MPIRKVRKGKLRVCSTLRSFIVMSLTVASLTIIVISALLDELNQSNFGVIVQKIGTYQAARDKTPKGPTLGYLEPITAVVLTTGDRMEALNTILGFYLNKTAQLVPEVKLLWNGEQEVKLNSEFERHERLTLYIEKHNTLNNRYRHWDSIKTSAVLLLDDDCIIRDIEKAITVYMRNTERIVSFYARTHKYDHHEKVWKYANPRTTNGRYSLGTGQASLLATHWLKDFNLDPQYGTKTHDLVDVTLGLHGCFWFFLPTVEFLFFQTKHSRCTYPFPCFLVEIFRYFIPRVVSI